MKILLKYPGYLTLRELAKFLGITRQTIKRWGGWYLKGKREDFPEAKKMGREWAWKVKEIFEFVGIGEEMKEKDQIKLEPLLKPTEVAQIAGVSLSMVRSWYWSGEIPYIKISKNIVRFRQEDVLRFFEDREVKRPSSKKNDIQENKKIKSEKRNNN